MTTKTITLNNGLTILLDPFHSNTLAIGLWLSVGSVNESNKQIGVAHMLEHMAFKGTKTRNAFDISKEIAAVEKAHNMGKPIRNYASEGPKHYHQFVDACLGKGECTAPFEYAARLTETILLGVIAGRFPNQTLHWNSKTAQFDEQEANEFLLATYREF